MAIKINKISNKEKALEQLKATGIKKSKTYGIIWEPRDKPFINFPKDEEKDSELNKMRL